MTNQPNPSEDSTAPDQSFVEEQGGSVEPDNRGVEGTLLEQAIAQLRESYYIHMEMAENAMVRGKKESAARRRAAAYSYRASIEIVNSVFANQEK